MTETRCVSDPADPVIHGRVIDGPPWKLALEVGRG